MIPPLWIQVKLYDDKRRLNLYLPMFLLWLILSPFILVGLVFFMSLILLRFLFTWRLESLRLIGLAYLFMCATRGTVIDLTNKKQQVLISIR